MTTSSPNQTEFEREVTLMRAQSRAATWRSFWVGFYLLGSAGLTGGVVLALTLSEWLAIAAATLACFLTRRLLQRLRWLNY